MDDILAYLETISQPQETTPGYRELTRKLSTYEKSIQKAFSLQFLDQLNDIQNDLILLERREGFARGFRLGMRLTLAAFQDNF